jgi:hypothetical protein
MQKKHRTITTREDTEPDPFQVAFDNMQKTNPQMNADLVRVE